MVQRFKPGDTAYIVENTRFVRKGTIIKKFGELYVFRFSDSFGGIKVRESRLFQSKEEADASIRKRLPPRIGTPWL